MLSTIIRNPSAGINKIELSVAHQLLAAGTDDGFVHLWDAREGQSGGGRSVASLDLRDAVGVAGVNAAEQTLEGFQVGGVASLRGLGLGILRRRGFFVAQQTYRGNWLKILPE